MPDQSHSHDHLAPNAPEFAGNIDIKPDETATSAFGATHADLPVFTLDQIVDDIDLINWGTTTLTVSAHNQRFD